MAKKRMPEYGHVRRAPILAYKYNLAKYQYFWIKPTLLE